LSALVCGGLALETRTLQQFATNLALMIMMALTAFLAAVLAQLELTRWVLELSQLW
jgi:hypothetical protein